MKCTYHPKVETELRCSKCGKPICPRCMVQTPVGARCPDCARVQRAPTYQVSSRHYLIAAGVGLGAALLLGLGWSMVTLFIRFAYLNLVVAAGVGWVSGELISRSVNRKRSVALAVIAAAAVGISYLIGIFLPWGWQVFHLFDLLALALGVYVAVTRIR